MRKVVHLDLWNGFVGLYARDVVVMLERAKCLGFGLPPLLYLLLFATRPGVGAATTSRWNWVNPNIGIRILYIHMYIYRLY